MSIKLISFDLDNTLWPADDLILSAQNQMIHWVEGAFPAFDTTDIESTLWQIRHELIKQQPSLKHNLTQLRKKIMLRFFMDQGLTDKDAINSSEQAFDVFFQWRNQVTLYPETVKTLKIIKKDFKLASITNGNSDLFRTPLKGIFDFSTSSEKAGISKPSPEIFNQVLNHFGFHGQQTMHVGDHPIEDILGAQQVSMTAVWFNPAETPWPENLNHKPEYTINKISDIESILF